MKKLNPMQIRLSFHIYIIEGGMSINQAAIHHNLPYSSLYGRINRLKRGEEEENAIDDTDAVSNSEFIIILSIFFVLFFPFELKFY